MRSQRKYVSILILLMFILAACSAPSSNMIDEKDDTSSILDNQNSTRADNATDDVTYIEFGYIDDFFGRITSYLDNFNTTSSSVQIKAKKYDTLDALTFDIIAGNVPDMICTEADVDQMRLYAAKGILLPLTNYLERINKDNAYFENILFAEKLNGEVFFFSPSYQLWGFSSPSECLSNADKIQNIDDLDALFSANVSNVSNIYSYMRQTDVLNNLLIEGLPLFIDYKNKSASFQNETFYNILKYCSRFPGEHDVLSVDSYPLFRFISVSSPAQLKVYSESQDRNTPYGQEISYVPMPFSIYNGMGITGAFYLGITCTTENEDACKRVLDYFLSESVQSQLSLQTPEKLPVMRAAVPTISESDSESSIDYDRLLLSLIENADHYSGSYYAPVQSIIVEEAEYYFKEAKSLEETIALIQNRVDLYLTELD